VPDKYDKRTPILRGTGCAISCNQPMFTVDEWTRLFTITAVATWVSLPLLVLLLLTWALSEEDRPPRLLLSFGIYALILALTFCASSSLPQEYTQCKTNAVAFTDDDPPNFCSAQALLLVFCAIGAGFSWAMLSLTVLLRLGLRVEPSETVHKVLLVIPLLLATTFLVYANYNEYGYGYIGFIPLCVPAIDADVQVLFPQLVLATLISFACMFSLAVAYVRVTYWKSADTEGSTSDRRNAVLFDHVEPELFFRRLRLQRYVILFIFFFSFIAVVVVYFLWYVYDTFPEFTESGKEFSTCVFKAFDGTNSWKRVCGSHPKKRLSSMYAGLVMFCISGLSLPLTLVYLSRESVWIFWYQFLGLDGGVGMGVGRRGKYTLLGQHPDDDGDDLTGSTTQYSSLETDPSPSDGMRSETKWYEEEDEAGGPDRGSAKSPLYGTF